MDQSTPTGPMQRAIGPPASGNGIVFKLIDVMMQLASLTLARLSECV